MKARFSSLKLTHWCGNIFLLLFITSDCAANPNAANPNESKTINDERCPSDIVLPNKVPASGVVPMDKEAISTYGNALSAVPKVVTPHPKHVALVRLLHHYQNCLAKGESNFPNVIIPYRRHHPNVNLLCKQLVQNGFLPIEDASIDIFDKKVEDALKAFQVANGLSPSGILTRDTRKCLNVPIKKLIEQVKQNIAKWGKINCAQGDHVIVNIPSFSLMFFRNGKEVFSTPVIVGMQNHKTPELSSLIKDVIVHPSWYVPPRLAKNLWGNVGSRGFHSDGSHLVQSPNATNPLGPIKFIFENPYSIVLHGTPKQHLFKQKNRTYSNGCVRVKDPEKIAILLLNGSVSEKQMKEYLKKRVTRTLHLPTHVPINIVYLTVWTDDAGRPHFFKDVYGRYDYEEDEEED